ncbi:MAG: hypothetical protein ACC726_16735 [Chloroflexota bacterium]
MSQPENPPEAPRDRRVLLLLAVLVAIVLAINLISAIVPGMDGTLASMPIVVLILVVGTIVVLVRSIRR